MRSYTPSVPSKTITDSRPKWTKCIPIFRPKRRKTLPDGAAHTYIASIREYPPGMYHEHWTKCSQENEVRTNIITTSVLRNFEILTAVFEFCG